MEKLIFIDVDGTLCDLEGQVPSSAIIAIKAARENGHKVFLCTGRAKSEIYQSIIDIGFDGLVGSAGAYVECEEEVVFHQSMEERQIRILVEYLQENKTPFILETNHGAFIQENDIKVLEEIFRNNDRMGNQDAERFIGLLNQVENVLEIDQVNKVLFFYADNSIEQMREDLKEYFQVLSNSIGGFGKNSGEISDKNINKAIGIQKVLAYYGKTKDTVIAFGDGPNDVEMLQFASIGVAMGNAWEKLKENADDITDEVDKNGIYNSFKKHKLI